MSYQKIEPYKPGTAGYHAAAYVAGAMLGLVGGAAIIAGDWLFSAAEPAPENVAIIERPITTSSDNFGPGGLAITTRSGLAIGDGPIVMKPSGRLTYGIGFP